ncbi:hypothetical protein WAI453_000785 [Rhynchosporium graminicola]
MSSSKPAAVVQSLDHIVLTVKSIPKTIEWYTSNLGMRSECFVSDGSPDIKRHSLIFGDQKINLHESEKCPDSNPHRPTGKRRPMLHNSYTHPIRPPSLLAGGMEILDLSPEKTDKDGTVLRTGARGTLRSIYCRDPDGNLVEISNYV